VVFLAVLLRAPKLALELGQSLVPLVAGHDLPCGRDDVVDPQPAGGRYMKLAAIAAATCGSGGSKASSTRIASTTFARGGLRPVDEEVPEIVSEFRDGAPALQVGVRVLPRRRRQELAAAVGTAGECSGFGLCGAGAGE